MNKLTKDKLGSTLQLCTVRIQYHPVGNSDRSGLMFGVVDVEYNEFRRTDGFGARRTYSLNSVTLVEVH